MGGEATALSPVPAQVKSRPPLGLPSGSVRANADSFEEAVLKTWQRRRHDRSGLRATGWGVLGRKCHSRFFTPGACEEGPDRCSVSRNALLKGRQDAMVRMEC
jgi:hypothetical protein